MNRWTVLLVAMLLALTVTMSCSGGGSPVAPLSNDPGITGGSTHTGQTQTHLWGFYTVYMDLENQTVEAVPDRNVMFTANVVTFVNKPPSNLAFNINETLVESGYIDVDIDVSISHPFPGMHDYDGYDVRGVFIGDQSRWLKYKSPRLKYGVLGNDQTMVDTIDCETLCGASDGYTRWFNPPEFATPGIMGYTDGIFASGGYKGSATLNPYKYFADGLGACDDLWGFLEANAGDFGVFAAGSTNTRNYYLRFPTPTPNVRYNYAIVANWEAADVHPSNAPEAVAASITVTDDIYYVDDTDKGGDLILDISTHGWKNQPAAIFVESSVLSAMYTLNPTEMTATGSGVNYSTYHVEITADNITKTGCDDDYWVIAEYDGFDYKNDFGIPNLANDALAAFFRHSLFVADEAYNKPPVYVSGVSGVTNPAEGTVETYSVVFTDPDLDDLIYSWTVSDPDTGDPIAGYENVEGDGAGNLDVDFGAIGSVPRDMYNIDCTATDGLTPPISAVQLGVRVIPVADWYVSNNADFASEPEMGTMAQPFHTISTALASAYAANDIFLVDAGTYNEQVYLNYGTACTIYGFDWYSTDPGGRPVIEFGTNYPVHLNYTNDCTIRGFTVQFASGASTNYLMRIYRSMNTTVMDCHLTGETSYGFPYGVYSYYSDNFTFTNNKISDFGTSSTSYAYPYGMYVYRGEVGHDISRNEMTTIQPTATSSYIYPYVAMCYYWPAGSKFNNNLIHHVKPSPGSGQSMYIYTMYMFYPYDTCEVGHNTIDQISLENSNYTYSGCYGMYIYDYSAYHANVHSNIVTSFYKYTSSQSTYGIQCYDGSNYCDVWDFPLGGMRYSNAPEGPNSINADPLYVEADDEPYDYQLDTGSPCIGTGFGSTDMGCYGGLASGQTVGLLSPE